MQNQAQIITLRASLTAPIVGQTALLDRLVIGLMAGGYILLEGLPGLAKTTAVKVLAGAYPLRGRNSTVFCCTSSWITQVARTNC